MADVKWHFFLSKDPPFSFPTFAKSSIIRKYETQQNTSTALRPIVHMLWLKILTRSHWNRNVNCEFYEHSENPLCMRSNGSMH